MMLFLCEIHRNNGDVLISVHSTHDLAMAAGFKEKEMRDDLNFFVPRFFELDGEPVYLESESSVSSQRIETEDDGA